MMCNLATQQTSQLLGIAQIRALPHDKFLDTLSLVDRDDNRKLDLHEFLNFMCIVEGILPSQSVEKGARATRPKLGSVQLELSVVDRPEEYQVSIKVGVLYLSFISYL